MYSNQFGKTYALVNIGHDELELDSKKVLNYIFKALKCDLIYISYPLCC